MLALLLRYQDVLKTLTRLSLTANKADARQQAAALKLSIEKFEFIFLLVLWEKILRNVKIVSKQLQSPDVDPSQVTNMLHTAQNKFKEFRDAFPAIQDETRNLAVKYGVNTRFEIVRSRKSKRFHDELASDNRLLNESERF